jgi:hypothetical protein
MLHIFDLFKNRLYSNQVSCQAFSIGHKFSYVSHPSIANLSGETAPFQGYDEFVFAYRASFQYNLSGYSSMITARYPEDSFT